MTGTGKVSKLPNAVHANMDKSLKWIVYIYSGPFVLRTMHFDMFNMFLHVMTTLIKDHNFLIEPVVLKIPGSLQYNHKTMNKSTSTSVYPKLVLSASKTW